MTEQPDSEGNNEDLSHVEDIDIEKLYDRVNMLEERVDLLMERLGLDEDIIREGQGHDD